ncbi:MAG: SDR family NAD(P)-dependent oxidoreductase [Acidimicrobiales bacterium]
MPPRALIWISGASSGIGEALASTAPWEPARIVGISRRPSPAPEDLLVDLADPASWPRVALSFEEEAAGFTGEVIVLVHAAGTVDPIGYAGEVGTAEYTRNVLLNSAAPQVLGHAFLKATAGHRARRRLVLLTSGAARTPYPGWSSYGGGKAACDQWARSVAIEQAERGGARVIAVAPGVVDTAMQAAIRRSPGSQFPRRPRFVRLHENGELTDPMIVAQRIWSLVDGPDVGVVVDLRDLGVSAS